MSSNGELAAHELAYIDEDNRLSMAAAAVWRQMQRDAAAAGVTIRATPTPAYPGLSGYRDLNAQDWLIDHPTGPAPIAPRGKSTHGWGTVVDVDLGLSWMRRNAARYGLVFDTIRNEPWHVLIRPPAWASESVTPITEGEEDMAGPLFVSPNIIIWPNGYASSYDPNVWLACMQVVMHESDEASKVATLVRESWAATRFIETETAQAAAAATKALLGAAGLSIDVDEAAIAAEVVRQLPPPPAYTATVNIAPKS